MPSVFTLEGPRAIHSTRMVRGAMPAANASLLGLGASASAWDNVSGWLWDHKIEATGTLIALTAIGLWFARKGK